MVSIQAPTIVWYLSHGLNTKPKVHYLSHGLNSKLKVSYSCHGLNTELSRVSFVHLSNSLSIERLSNTNSLIS